jgi:DNA adenine methylase
MSRNITQPLKWPGGKFYMAKHIHTIAAPFKFDAKSRPDGWLHRVIPFAGGLGEFWNWDYEGVSEVVNDINLELTNFWLVLQNDSDFQAFQRIVQAIPFSQVEYQMATEMEMNSRVYRAVAFFVKVRQSLAGRMDSFAPVTRNRTRRGMNEQVSAWLNAVEGLPAVHERLMRVLILNNDALKVIRQQDGPKTLFYCDCPYLHETRASTDLYDHEMSAFQHAQLLVTLSKIKGRFMLSGYDSSLYRHAETKYGWKRHEVELPNNSAGGETKRRMTEVIWSNF